MGAPALPANIRIGWKLERLAREKRFTNDLDRINPLLYSCQIPLTSRFKNLQDQEIFLKIL